MTVSQWSNKRLAEWREELRYSSLMGVVEQTLGGMWQGKVVVVRDGQRVYAKLSELFESADVAMGAVERTWKRENER